MYPLSTIKRRTIGLNVKSHFFQKHPVQLHICIFCNLGIEPGPEGYWLLVYTRGHQQRKAEEYPGEHGAHDHQDQEYCGT